MVPLTRRGLLHGAAGLAAGLAGCNGIDGQGGSTRTPSPTARRDDRDPDANSTTDPETLRVRVAGDRPPIWLSGADRTDGRSAPGDSRHLSSIVVADRSRAERVEITDVPAGERARSFLANTSFGSETVYVETHRVRACFRLDFCRVSWQPTRIETDYARTLLPYDERCAADAWAAEAWLIRIPAALSEDDVNGYTTSVGSADCDRAPEREEARGTGESGNTDGSGDSVSVSDATVPENTRSDGGR